MKKILIIITMISFLYSCNKEPIIKNLFVSLESFDQVNLEDAFEVFLTEGSNFSIEIIGDEDKIDNIDFSVNDKILTVENKNKMGWLTPKKNKIQLKISSTPLKKITAKEGCNIQSKNPITSSEFGLVLQGKLNQATLQFDGNTFYYWNNFPCGGKVTLYGKSETLKLWNYAIMSVDAKYLSSKNVIIENNSKGDCEITALNRLEYSITGEGNIHLFGETPEIINNGTSSSGRLIQH